MNEELISGYSIQDWVEMIDCEVAEDVEKALDYYDGDQEEAMEELLDHPSRGRKQWKERGIIPRFRNITKAIVEKSGKLFKDNAPVIEIFNAQNVIDDTATNTLTDVLDRTEWLEFFSNLDSAVRLTKTVFTLVQYDAIDKTIEFELLHRANSAVLLDSTLKHVQAVIYQTAEQDNIETYRLITLTEYIDIAEIEDEATGASRVAITNRQPNPYGIVPIAVFHDTNKPRNGIWNKPGMDLISINELYNLHLTDSEYAISWAKLPTLFTNCTFAETHDSLELSTPYGSKLPHLVPAAPDVIGGPSRAIILESQGVDQPFVKYESPKIDLKPLDDVIAGWIQQYASDWSVRLTTAGQASATSGFQLVVEEIPNLELRQLRAKQFQNGFKRLYEIIKIILNTQAGYNVLDPASTIYVDFGSPKLPVDEKATEEMWNLRIAGNRASAIDYLMIENGFTKDEAIAKYDEIIKFNMS